ncbi:NFACT RNA binding domain-containing protein [Halobacteriovorax sp. JY17]|uniref:NFACT RNA binding domain-containing protein n=1 Tax=Halobacteriovorax sp. JY17 TaxID=2014617 RepID=UPI000C555078|nr:NFACT RNA binding domain-containing protein [Halobacteriovorax sp. JY17]PIK14457.1 MAG: hypothetical protein CES88_08930 [Halobacteriovorax sp. JY17]
MIQTVADLNNIIEEYNSLCVIDQRVRTPVIQKIFSTPHYLSMSLRLPGKSIFLYVGRGQKYEGIFIGKSAVPTEYRIRDRFIEFCRKYLQGGIVHRVENLLEDRVVNIYFTKREDHYNFTLFWKGRDLYFALHERSSAGERVFCSWIGWQEVLEGNSIENIFKEVGAGSYKAEKPSKKVFSDEEYFEALSKNVDVHKFPKRKKKFFLRKIQNIERDFIKVKKWKLLKEVIEQPGFKLSSEFSFELEGISFKIDVNFNEFKRRDVIYKKIKAFRKAETILEDRLLRTKEEFKKWVSGDVYIVKGLGKTVEPVWRSSKEDVNSQVISVNRKIYRISSGVEIGIGLDSLSNDWLRKNWAKKEDLWFHLDGEKSSHVFLKNNSGVILDAKLLQLIGSALAHYSQYEGQQVPMVYTQVKNLKSVKGSAGKVIFKKEKRIDVYIDPDWKERISIIS